MNNDSTQRIREQNDQFRQRMMIPTFGAQTIRGKTLMTKGITDLGPEAQIVIAAMVRDYDNFTKENDPYGEHDFGAFEYNSRKIFWKIDYYAPDMQHGSEDPADPKQTIRVLTVMLAEEY